MKAQQTQTKKSVEVKANVKELTDEEAKTPVVQPNPLENPIKVFGEEKAKLAMRYFVDKRFNPNFDEKGTAESTELATLIGLDLTKKTEQDAFGELRKAAIAEREKGANSKSIVKAVYRKRYGKKGHSDHPISFAKAKAVKEDGFTLEDIAKQNGVALKGENAGQHSMNLSNTLMSRYGEGIPVKVGKRELTPGS